MSPWVPDCPQMDTALPIGPTGEKPLPLTVKNAGPAPASSGTLADVSEARDPVVAKRAPAH